MEVEDLNHALLYADAPETRVVAELHCKSSTEQRPGRPVPWNNITPPLSTTRSSSDGTTPLKIPQEYRTGVVQRSPSE